MSERVSNISLPTENRQKQYHGKYGSEKHPGWCKYCKRKASGLCDDCTLKRGKPEHFKPFPGVDNIPAAQIGSDVERDESSNWRG